MPKPQRRSGGKPGAHKTEITLPDRAAARFIALVREFLPSSRRHFQPYGAWRRMGNNGIWRNFLSQVVVAGGSKPWDSLSGSPEAMRLLSYGSLRTLSKSRQSRIVNRLFREHGVRYTSQNRSKCRKTAAVVANLKRLDTTRGGPKGYLKYLCERPEDERASQIAKDFCFIKLKGSRDLSAGLGLAKNVIALDARLLNLLRAAGVKYPKTIQTNSWQYRSLHDSLLRQVCKPAGVTGAQLDRTLYNNYPDIRARLAARNSQRKHRPTSWHQQ